MKLGAFDYFIKTDEEDRIVGGVLRAVRMLEMQRDYREMSDRLWSQENCAIPRPLPPSSPATGAMLTIFSYVEAVAKSPQPLLITGESGVGKELIARAAHRLSGCRGKLVTVNVAGLDDTVFADTLFGHVRGAFTGAEQARRGMVEEAADGTLFLDEIGDLSIPSQVKLLRLLQEGEYFPARQRPAQAAQGPGHRRHPPESGGQGTERGLPPGPLLPPAYPSGAYPAPAGAERGHPAAAGPFSGGGGPHPRQEEADPAQGTGPASGHLRFPGNVRELKAMVYDAVSIHRDRMLSMDSFVQAVGAAASRSAATGRRYAPQNPFSGFEELPTFSDAAGFLVMEAHGAGRRQPDPGGQAAGHIPAGALQAVEDAVALRDVE